MNPTAYLVIQGKIKDIMKGMKPDEYAKAEFDQRNQYSRSACQYSYKMGDVEAKDQFEKKRKTKLFSEALADDKLNQLHEFLEKWPRFLGPLYKRYTTCTSPITLNRPGCESRLDDADILMMLLFGAGTFNGTDWIPQECLMQDVLMQKPLDILTLNNRAFHRYYRSPWSGLSFIPERNNIITLEYDQERKQVALVMDCQRDPNPNAIAQEYIIEFIPIRNPDGPIQWADVMTDVIQLKATNMRVSTRNLTTWNKMKV